MSGVHSRFAPSGLSLTMACAGSFKLRETVPVEPETPESIEGTVAHHVAQQLALGIRLKEGDKYMDTEVDDDMVAGADLWVDTVGTNGAHELPVLCPDIHPDCWGTPDFWKYDVATGVLHVWDYKYGHRYVEEFENVQMCAYASGLIRMLSIPETTVVQIGIVQPRCYMANPVRQWTTTAQNILSIAKRAGEAVADALLGGYCRTGPHCIDCPARGVCKTLQYATNVTISFIQAAELNDPTAAALGVELTLLDAAEKLVEARRKALAVMAESLVRSGQRVPGWEMKPGRSNLTWLDEAAAISAGDSAGVDLRKPAKPITPTQAIQRKLLAEPVVNMLASRPPAAMKLARVSPVSIRKALSST